MQNSMGLDNDGTGKLNLTPFPGPVSGYNPCINPAARERIVRVAPTEGYNLWT